MDEMRPLWWSPDQAERLAELVATEPGLKEAPLRRDVRFLGVLLGRVLKEQCGIELFNTVEYLREALISHREADDTKSDLMQKAQNSVADLSLAEA